MNTSPVLYSWDTRQGRERLLPCLFARPKILSTCSSTDYAKVCKLASLVSVSAVMKPPPKSLLHKMRLG